jgi:predicted transcriptional regulator
MSDSAAVSADMLGLTAQIVSAHIGNNQVGAEALPSLIQSVYRSLTTAGNVEAPSPAAAQTPAVPVSLTPEAVSLKIPATS